MMDMEQLVAGCIATLQKTDEYKEYYEARQALDMEPEKRARLNECREENYRLQQSMDANSLFEADDRLREKYADVLSDPVIIRFCDAEIAFCKLVQTLQTRILEGIDFY